MKGKGKAGLTGQSKNKRGTGISESLGQNEKREKKRKDKQT